MEGTSLGSLSTCGSFLLGVPPNSLAALPQSPFGHPPLCSCVLGYDCSWRWPGPLPSSSGWPTLPGLSVMGFWAFAYVVPSLWDTLPLVSGTTSFLSAFRCQTKHRPRRVLPWTPVPVKARSLGLGTEQLAGLMDVWETEGVGRPWAEQSMGKVECRPL